MKREPFVILTMIVKDEASIIVRCLESAREWIDAVCVVDTGSSDHTVAEVERWIAERSFLGAVHTRPWVDFGHNRTEALQLARALALVPIRDVWALTLDADETIDAPDYGIGVAKQRKAMLCDRDEVNLPRRQVGSEFTFWRPAFMRLALDWQCRGVLHEAWVCDAPVRRVALSGPAISYRGDSARGTDAGKFTRDAALLFGELERNPRDTRTAFYLAQSLRDAGELERARAAYRHRIDMGGWEEEVFYSRFQLGVIAERMGDTRGAVGDYIAAWSSRPNRLEPLIECSRMLRLAEAYPAAMAIADLAIAGDDSRSQIDTLFIDQSVTWRRFDELSISAFWCGKFVVSADAATMALECDPPENHRTRIEANRDMARRKVRKDKAR